MTEQAPVAQEAVHAVWPDAIDFLARVKEQNWTLDWLVANAMAEAIAKLTEERAAQGWRPIATARHEELQEILATNGLFFDKCVFIPRKEGDGREGPGWMAEHGDVTPTHWRPIPDYSRRTLLALASSEGEGDKRG